MVTCHPPWQMAYVYYLHSQTCYELSIDLVSWMALPMMFYDLAFILEGQLIELILGPTLE